MVLTKEQVQEQLSLTYVRAIASALHYSCTEPGVDMHGVDLQIEGIGFKRKNCTWDAANLDVQLKSVCADELDPNRDFISYPLKVRNYDLLRDRNPNITPAILLLYVLPREAEKWVQVLPTELLLKGRAYWVSLDQYPTTTNTTSVTIELPSVQVFNKEQLEFMMCAIADGGRNLKWDPKL